jgi:hypothetical protein
MDGGNSGRKLSDVAARQGLGDQMRLIPSVQLVTKVLDVPLDRSRRNSKLLRALLRGKPACDALQDFTLAVRQGHEVFLLPRKIHHASPYWETTRFLANKLSYHRLTAY